MSLEGLPHSGIFGSKPVCGSPKLFAAYHALHRLLAPRHSPYALSSLTIRTLEHERLGLQTTAHSLRARSGPAACSLKPAAWRRSFQVCTLRVCGRKTTVAKYSVVKEPRSDRLLLFQKLCGRLAIGDPPHASLSALWRVQPSRGLPPVAHARVGTRERRLENTGLEPVTSWLQTRRSPS
jgi:hypothetical protein